MMMRSMPPASAHLALMPAPAPPPMIAWPAATWARRRVRQSSRVKLIVVPQGCGLILYHVVAQTNKWRSELCQVHPLSSTMEALMPVILLGTLDTKGAEYQFVRDILHRRGVATLVIDAGTRPPTFPPDIGSDHVFAAAGTSLEIVRKTNDRGQAVEAA